MVAMAKQHPRPQGYKAFLMLNSNEHEVSTAEKAKILKKKSDFFLLKHSDVVFC